MWSAADREHRIVARGTRRLSVVAGVVIALSESDRNSWRTERYADRHRWSWTPWNEQARHDLRA
jgi:hypothetical protein